MIRCGCTIDCGSLQCSCRKNGLWLVLIVKVWHAKMQVLKVSQMMKELVNNVHPMGQFGLLNCIYQISQFVMNVITPNLSSIGCRISADSWRSHRIVDPLPESWIWICYYLKIIGYQNRILDIRQSFVST